MSTSQTLPDGAGKLALLWIGWFVALACVTLLGLQALAKPSPLWIVAAAAPIGAAVIWFRPHMSTFLCVFLMYSNIPVVAAQFHGAPYAGVIAVPGLLLLPIAYFLWVKKEGVVFPLEAMLVMLLVTIQALGVISCRDPEFAFKYLVRNLGEGLGLFLLMINAVRTPQIVRGALWSLLGAGLFMGAITGHQYATKSYHSNYAGFAQADQLGYGAVNAQGVMVTMPRSAGSVGEKNRYAQNMLMLLPLGLCLAYNEKKPWLKAAAWGAIFFTAIGWGVAFSRGSVVGLGATVAVLTWLGYMRPRYIIGMAIGAALMVAILPQYRERVTSLVSIGQFFSKRQSGAEVDGSLKSRATEMLAAARVFVDHPIIGVGPGMFPYYAREYGQASGFRALEGKRQAHNLYLGVAADHGILGIACFLGAIFVTIFKLHHLRKNILATRPDLAVLAAAMVAALVMYLTTGMFLHFSYVRYFWLIYGLATAVGYVIQRECSDPTPSVES